LFSFRSGHYSTKFIGNEYPNGFHGVQLKEHETFEFLALAAALHSARNEELTGLRSTKVCFFLFCGEEASHFLFLFSLA